MLSFFSSLGFTHPAFLGALLAVPLLWWLLKLLPPRARRVQLPTAFLLRQLTPAEQTAAKTPWWIIMMRMALMALLILAAADPVMGRQPALPSAGGTVLVVFDNGWASAAQWKTRMETLDAVLGRVDADNIILLPTAPPLGRAGLEPLGPLTLSAALSALPRLKPQPWAAEHGLAIEKVNEIAAQSKITRSFFFSDGTRQQATPDLIKTLQDKGALTVITDDKINQPFLLLPAESENNALNFTLSRLQPQGEAVNLQALTAEGTLLDARKINFPAGERTVNVTWEMPDGMKNQVAAVRLQAPDMAAAAYLIDKTETAPVTGIIADSSREGDKSFLNDVYYLRRALESGHSLLFATAAELVKKSPGVIIWPDSAVLTVADREVLSAWTEKGGLLIRFAGPNLAAQSAGDALLPVEIRAGERVLQGTLTGDHPLGIAPPAKDSPFADLVTPKDVTLTRQLLAVPTPDVFEKTWLSLEDGSPFITGGKKGSGTIVLIHSTAGPAWSNFCYSGFYVDVLSRLIARGKAIGSFRPESGALVVTQVMDGFGVLQGMPAGVSLQPLAPDAAFYPSAQTPPGIYAREGTSWVFNFGDAVQSMQALDDLPAGVTVIPYQQASVKSFKGLLLKMAAVLLVADTLVMLGLSGFFRWRRAVTAAVLLMLFLPATADASPLPAELSAGIYLGHIETGDQRIDDLSYNGLTGLQEVLNARTMAKIKGVAAVDPARDDLSFYPFLYWPMTAAQPKLSLSAIQNLQNYLQEGGLLMIDTRDGNADQSLVISAGAQNLKRLTADLAIPALMSIGPGHILTRSFYLLDRFPGQMQTGDVWVEKEPSAANDSVTGLIVGGNNWAAAWSMEDSDRQRFPVTPGGEAQREMSYRFGVNTVMMALTGNYKADQIHSAAIIKKLQQ